jgi:DNA-binding transcriptional ArsR family regulator
MEKNIVIDLEDSRTNQIADVISNKTSKKILSFLAESSLEEGLSESEASKKLGIKANTVGYNFKKLKKAGLIEETGKVLWSEKGKRIRKYRVVNKKIVISPKKLGIKGVIPAVVVSGILALGIRMFYVSGEAATGLTRDMELAVSSVAESAGEKIVSDSGSQIYYTLANVSNEWAWFFIGALTGLLVLILWNSKRNERRVK